MLDKNLEGEMRTLVKITFDDIESLGTIRDESSLALSDDFTSADLHRSLATYFR